MSGHIRPLLAIDLYGAPRRIVSGLVLRITAPASGLTRRPWRPQEYVPEWARRNRHRDHRSYSLGRQIDLRRLDHDRLNSCDDFFFFQAEDGIRDGGERNAD